MFAERDKHYPSRSGQTSLTTAVTNITKPVTENNFGPRLHDSRKISMKRFHVLYTYPKKVQTAYVISNFRPSLLQKHSGCLSTAKPKRLQRFNGGTAG